MYREMIKNPLEKNTQERMETWFIVGLYGFNIDWRVSWKENGKCNMIEGSG